MDSQTKAGQIGQLSIMVVQLIHNRYKLRLSRTGKVLMVDSSRYNSQHHSRHKLLRKLHLAFWIAWAVCIPHNTSNKYPNNSIYNKNKEALFLISNNSKMHLLKGTILSLTCLKSSNKHAFYINNSSSSNSFFCNSNNYMEAIMDSKIIITSTMLAIKGSICTTRLNHSKGNNNQQ